ncbi:hypothetical protein GGR23_001663 [Gellertiella hungarica]|uniref:Uncharacterized protein n=1 Tax=Gellertiella hungarica TaxID=1572859 RepID=A0A7W6J466_9HYPH|nr:hypothetical protein [Gellertiella hungarica]
MLRAILACFHATLRLLTLQPEGVAGCRSGRGDDGAARGRTHPMA